MAGAAVNEDSHLAPCHPLSPTLVLARDGRLHLGGASPPERLGVEVVLAPPLLVSEKRAAQQDQGDQLQEDHVDRPELRDDSVLRAAGERGGCVVVAGCRLAAPPVDELVRRDQGEHPHDDRQDDGRDEHIDRVGVSVDTLNDRERQRGEDDHPHDERQVDPPVLREHVDHQAERRGDIAFAAGVVTHVILPGSNCDL